MVVMPAMFARAGASVRQPERRVRLAERLICVVDRFRHPGYLTCPSASGCWPQTKLGGEEPPMTRRLALAAAAAAATLAASAFAQEPLIFDSSLGEVEIFPLGHASLRIEVNDVVMHIDPWSNVADYSTQPDADLVLVTHTHQDHFDPSALEAIAAEDTVFVMDGTSAGQFSGGATALANGESLEFEGIVVTAVPAYNVQR